MGWTKAELLDQGFQQIGLAGYVFDLPPEQLQSALKTLDSMMATWNGRGIRLGYPIPSTASGSSGDEDSGIPDYANEAVFLNLGIRLASTVGKPVSVELKANAKQALDSLLAKAAMPREMNLPTTMPKGAGHKTHRNTNRPFLDQPEDVLEAGPDSDLDFE
jgi:hypothetical protein